MKNNHSFAAKIADIYHYIWRIFSTPGGKTRSMKNCGKAQGIIPLPSKSFWIGPTLRKPTPSITCYTLIWNLQGKRNKEHSRNTWRPNTENEIDEEATRQKQYGEPKTKFDGELISDDVWILWKQNDLRRKFFFWFS